MYPAETVVRPGSGDGAASSNWGVEGAWDSGAVVVACHVAGGWVGVGVLVPGALDQIFLTFVWVGPFVALQVLVIIAEFENGVVYPS
jgi:hypothetical protein